MGIKVIIKNKKSHYDYFLEDKIEAGVQLFGTEVKSIRDGKVKIAESHITIDNNNEVWIHNMNIAHYKFGNINNHEETRRRKLLLSQSEITKYHHRMQAESMTLIPTMLYFKGSLVKLEIALAKGKKKHDKRATEAKRDVERKLRQGNYDD